MDQNASEIVALQAMAWLLANKDLAEVFLGSTGMDPGDLKARASDPETLAAVLDFIFMDDAWVLGASAEIGCRPEELQAARRVLPGADAPSWT